MNNLTKAKIATVLAILSLIISIVSFAIPVLVVGGNLTIFEDGSFWLFDWSGCLPFSLCN